MDKTRKIGDFSSAWIYKVTGYELLTQEQREEMDNLQERCTHRATMRFTPLDSIHLYEYERLCKRLEREPTQSSWPFF